MLPSLSRLALAASLLPATLAQIQVRSDANPEAAVTNLSQLDFSDAASPQTINFGGLTLGCKCIPGDSCWPSAKKWNALNATVGGRLQVHIPPGAVCHNTFQGPLGTINTYNATACAEVLQKFSDQFWT